MKESEKSDIFDRYRIKDYIFSYDTYMAIITGIMILCFIGDVKNDFMVELYGMTVNILLILVLVMFICIASIFNSSNEFIGFLHKNGLFKNIITKYRWTMMVLIITFIFAFIMYMVSLYLVNCNIETQHSVILAIFGSLFIYGIVAIFNVMKFSLYLVNQRINKYIIKG